MISIRMAMRQVKKITKLIRNVKPIMYPTSNMLFAYSIFFYKCEKAKELEQKSHKPFNLKHKPNLEERINSITKNAIRSASKTFTISFKLMFNLIVEYRIILEKLISIYKEILADDISDTKIDSLLELHSEIQSKTQQILTIQRYMNHIKLLISSAMKLNFVLNIRDIKVEQQIEEMSNKLRKELENISQLEQEYGHVQKQCIKKTENADLKWYNAAFVSKILLKLLSILFKEK